VNVLILAAGLGTRLRPVTLTVPKPCVPFLNVPMGLYNFRFLQHLKISQLVVNTFHLPDKIIELYENQPYYTDPILFSHESGSILGSAGGLKKAAELFKFKKSEDETILMLNADEILFDVDEKFLLQAYEHHVREKNYATLVTMSHPEAGKKFGGIWCEGDRVKNIGKMSSSQNQVPLHYIGMIFLNRAALNEIPSDREVNIFYDFLIHKLESEKVFTYSIDCTWFETGNFNDYLEATKSVIRKLGSNVTLQDFISTYDNSELIINSDSISLVSKSVNVTSNCILRGTNCISKTTNPKLLKDSGLIEDSVLFSDFLMNQKYFEAKAP
jgi:mannose-1-phosphate guanylyltransferase